MTRLMKGQCRGCGHFEVGGRAIEAAFPGLAAMSSGYASVRGGDGLCGLRDLYLPGTDGCGLFAPAATGGGAPPG